MKKNQDSRTGTAGGETSEVQDSAVLGSEAEGDPAEYNVSRKERSVQLTPVFTASPLPVRTTRGPGRPYSLNRRPSPADEEYHARMIRERETFIGMDPVVQGLDEKIDSLVLLRRIERAIGVETAALAFQRLETEKLGRDTSHVSARRIDALVKIANIELDIRKLGADTIDLKGEKFQKIFQFLINAFRNGCVEIGMAPEQIDILFNHLSTSLEGWEEKVTDLIR